MTAKAGQVIVGVVPRNVAIRLNQNNIRHEKLKTLEHPILTKLLWDLVDVTPVYKTGTYNKQDPTHFEKGQLDYRGLRLKYFDNCWGIDFTLCTIDINKRDGVVLAKFGLYDNIVSHGRKDCLKVLKVLYNLRKGTVDYPKKSACVTHDFERSLSYYECNRKRIYFQKEE